MRDHLDQGVSGMTVQQILDACKQKRFSICRSTVKNNLGTMVDGKTPALQRVANKRGAYRLNPYWLRSNG